MAAVFLVGAAFLASAVEMVEALTIVLAVGVTRGWRSTLIGVASAIVLVTAAGAVAHRPLSQVPENTMKFAVGAVLTTFGIFWSAEGTGVEWPGHEVAILGVLASVVVWSLLMVAVLRRTKE